MTSRAVLGWIVAAFLAGSFASSAQAQLASWTLYETPGGKQLSFGGRGSTGQDVTFAVVCERFELFLHASTTDTPAKARMGTFSLASQRKNAFFTGAVKTIGASRVIVASVPATDPVFAMIEEGNFAVRETTGKLIAEVKINNTLLKKIVYECRR